MTACSQSNIDVSVMRGLGTYAIVELYTGAAQIFLRTDVDIAVRTLVTLQEVIRSCIPGLMAWKNFKPNLSVCV